jgi:hypothetical protein
MCVFFSELELSVRGKDRGLTEGQKMHLYECKAVQTLSIFLLFNIRDPGEDEDFIDPDVQANPLLEGFSLASGTTVHVSRHVNTAITPPATDDYTSIPVGMNMTHKEPSNLGPNPSWPCLVSGNINQINHFLLTYYYLGRCG